MITADPLEDLRVAARRARIRAAVARVRTAPRRPTVTVEVYSRPVTGLTAAARVAERHNRAVSHLMALGHLIRDAHRRLVFADPTTGRRVACSRCVSSGDGVTARCERCRTVTQ